MRKWIWAALSAALAVLCVAVCLWSDPAASAVEALCAPFALGGAGLRRLSLSGAVGNGVAVSLWALLSLLPLGGLWALRRRLQWEDALLALLTPLLGLTWWCAVNPGRLSVQLPEMELAYLSGAVWMTLICWTLLRLLRACFAGRVAWAVGVLLRNCPQDIGRQPHVSGTVKVVEQRAASHGERELSHAAHALLVAAIVGVGCGSGGGVAYISILMTSNGISEVFAATLLSVVGLALVLGKFSVGAVMDAVGTRRGSMIFFAIFVAGLLLCCCAALRNPALCVAAAVLYGFGAALGSTGVSVWSIEFSGSRNRARVARDFQCAYAAGGFIFNLLPGILYELTGTYVTAYALLAALIAASMLLVAAVYHRSSR